MRPTDVVIVRGVAEQSHAQENLYILIVSDTMANVLAANRVSGKDRHGRDQGGIVRRPQRVDGFVPIKFLVVGRNDGRGISGGIRRVLGQRKSASCRWIGVSVSGRHI